MQIVNLQIVKTLNFRGDVYKLDLWQFSEIKISKDFEHAVI
jgi:hypothetical protein